MNGICSFCVSFSAGIAGKPFLGRDLDNAANGGFEGPRARKDDAVVSSRIPEGVFMLRGTVLHVEVEHEVDTGCSRAGEGALSVCASSPYLQSLRGLIICTLA